MRGESLAGVGRADVTPTQEVALEGYHRAGRSAGVLDPLLVTALALSADGTDLAVLLTVDNVGLLVSETRRIREAVAARLGVPADRTMMCFSHTHSAPRATPEYLDLVAARSAEAAAGAVGSLRPARVGWGVGEVGAGVNRRPRGPDGRAFHGVNTDGPVDRRLGVLRVDGNDGRPLAALLWHGAHGNVLGGDSSVISADWPGAARAVVERALGCPALVALGSCGNVNPRWRGGVDALRQMGAAVGEEALRVLAHAETAPLTALAMRSETIPLRLLPLPDEAEARRIAAEVAERWGVSAEAWVSEVMRLRERGEVDRSLPLEVAALRVSEGVLAGIPMEPFAEIGLAVAGRFPGRPIFFGGYTNGWIGYLPVPEEYPAGGYEVEWAPAVYGLESGWQTAAVPETAVQVVGAAARLIGAALGSERG